MKQARKTHLFPAVVFGFVDQGEIMGTFACSATSEAGTAPRLAFGPTMARTLSSFTRRFAASTASPAEPLLSSIDEPELMALSGDLHAAGVELGHGHFGRVLARGADGGNVAAQLGDHADGQDRATPFFRRRQNSAAPERRRNGSVECLLMGVSPRAL